MSLSNYPYVECSECSKNEGQFSGGFAILDLTYPLAADTDSRRESQLIEPALATRPPDERTYGSGAFQIKLLFHERCRRT